MADLYLLNSRAPTNPEYLTDEQTRVIEQDGDPGSGYCEALVTQGRRQWRPCNGKTCGIRAGFRVCTSHWVADAIRVPRYLQVREAN